MFQLKLQHNSVIPLVAKQFRMIRPNIVGEILPV